MWKRLLPSNGVLFLHLVAYAYIYNAHLSQNHVHLSSPQAPLKGLGVKKTWERRLPNDDVPRLCLSTRGVQNNV
eukprot:1218384-Lingulodinium_polyedra.AAC.1